RFGLSSHLGIAVATSVGGWLNALLLYRGLVRRGHYEADARLKWALPMIVLSSAVMALALIAGTYHLAPRLAVGQPLVVRGGALALLILASAFIYFAMAFLSGAIRPAQIGRVWRRRT